MSAGIATEAGDFTSWDALEYESSTLVDVLDAEAPRETETGLKKKADALQSLQEVGFSRVVRAHTARSHVFTLFPWTDRVRLGAPSDGRGL